MEIENKAALTDEELETVSGGNTGNTINRENPVQGVKWVCNKCKEERITAGNRPPKIGCRYWTHAWSIVHN